MRAYDVFYQEVVEETKRSRAPASRLAGMARCYVRFAGLHRSLFELLFVTGIDKCAHPEVEAAEKPLSDALLESVTALAGEGQSPDDLATAIEAAAHGHAMMLLNGDFGSGDAAVEEAAERAAAATLALIEGRELLSRRHRPRKRVTASSGEVCRHESTT